MTVAESDGAHRWPWFLPDGRHFLYLALRGETGELRVGSLTPGDTVTLGPSETNAAYAAGHLFFVRGGNLLAQPFDTEARQTKGDPLRLDVQAGVDLPWQRGIFTVSATGRLVYRPTARALSQLTWFDRRGTAVGTVGAPGVYFNLDLSPDEQRVAISQLTQPGGKAEFDIWLIEAATGRTTRLTDDPALEFDPAWSPDGAHIAFNSNRSNQGHGSFGLFVRAADGSGEDVALAKVETRINITGPDWSRTGIIAFNNSPSPGTNDLWTLSMSGERKPTVFLSSKHDETSGVFSPDSKWIAHDSTASGSYEVYVRPFPGKEPVHPVSRDGGRYPRWRKDGKELFFVAPDGTMMAASVETTKGFAAGVPQPLFRTHLGGEGVDNRPYAVTKDGQRFLIPILAAQPLRVVMDWRTMLPR